MSPNVDKANKRFLNMETILEGSEKKGLGIL
jgi:hypothetical protein